MNQINATFWLISEWKTPIEMIGLSSSLEFIIIYEIHTYKCTLKVENIIFLLKNSSVYTHHQIHHHDSADSIHNIFIIRFVFFYSSLNDNNPGDEDDVELWGWSQEMRNDEDGKANWIESSEKLNVKWVCWEKCFLNKDVEDDDEDDKKKDDEKKKIYSYGKV